MEELRTPDNKPDGYIFTAKEQWKGGLPPYVAPHELLGAIAGVYRLANEDVAEGNNPENHYETKMKHYESAEKRRGIARTMEKFIGKVTVEDCTAACAEFRDEFEEYAAEPEEPTFFPEEEASQFLADLKEKNESS